MRSQTDTSPWSMRRATRGGGTDVPVTRPERLQAVALADLTPLLDEFNRGVERARRAYYYDTRGPAHHTLLDERTDQ